MNFIGITLGELATLIGVVAAIAAVLASVRRRAPGRSRSMHNSTE